MKKIFILFLLVISCFFLQAQTLIASYAYESNNVIATGTTIKLAAFSAIKIDENIRAVIIPAADSGYLYLKNKDKIKYSILKNTLRIKAKNALLSNKIITVFIGVKDINNLILNGNASVITNGLLPSAELKITCNDNSNCVLQTTAKKITATQTAKSKITIEGLYNVHQSYVNGYGDIVFEFIKKELQLTSKN